jgi:hypothetical protein
MKGMPIFELLHSWDFMDPNENVYASNSTCQKTEVIAQDQGSPMHEDPTLHDFQSIFI